LRGLRIYPDESFKFDFIVDPGEDSLSLDQMESRTQDLVKYFLSSLTTPEEELWVNLTPGESERIIPESFGRTLMGQELLAQDYLLKNLTASLLYPETKIGKRFWERVYALAWKKYGITDIPHNMFNRVWIVPDDGALISDPARGSIVHC